MLADFRSVYHLGWTEAMRLSGPEFLILASRLPFYSGVMKVRAEQEAERERRNVRDPTVRLVDERDPSFAGLIQFG